VYTGTGDFVGVALGHTLFYNTVGRLYLPVNGVAELQTGILLGSAAWMTGFVWQPIVNLCHDLHMSFTPAMVTVGLIGGLWFYVGLRFFREFYGRACGWDGINHSVGMLSDFQLSLVIACADAAFVGTDVGFAGNWLAPIVGVVETDTMMQGMCKAGTSTFLGYTAGQMAENFTIGKKKLWLD